MTHAASATPPPYLRRADRIRAMFPELALDGLLVTHPPNLRYLAGFDGSLGALLLTATRCLLIVDGRYITAARDRIAASPALAHVEAELAERSIEEAIATAVLRERSGAVIGVEAAAVTLARFDRLETLLAHGAANSGAVAAPALEPTECVVESLRLVKDETEAGVLRRAARMLSAVAEEALECVAPGRTEQEVAGDIDDAIRRAGFARPAFDTIVAAGPHSALPHARPGTRVLAAGDGVVLDFGGVYDGYCVDLTRTVQLAPRTPEFGRLYEAVAAAHAAAIAAIRPGVAASVVDGAARAVLVARGLGEAFLHGTGHGLGLEIHEEPRVARAGTAERDHLLLPGMVFTVEPGAYVPGLGGVRIEDDVLVTDEGCEVLTAVPIDRTVYGVAITADRHSRRRDPAGE